MTLRCGLTTGTCAAAAAKAAAAVLAGRAAMGEVEIRLPRGEVVQVPLVSVDLAEDGSHVTAAVRKDAGDDPDVTNGLVIRAAVSWHDGPGVIFAAGEGIGTVTKPGLQIPPGEPAINPMPRSMIAAAIREVTPRGVRVEISIPGGKEIAAQTFNPRLGIEGGLSILGTTGIVRPYCTKALHDALRCAFGVAAACDVTAPILVPGNIGANAATRHFKTSDEQLIEVGNEWGFVVDRLADHPFRAVLLVGHPGKLAKLADGQWDTHSARSAQAGEYIAGLCSRVLQHPAPTMPTVEGMLAALTPPERTMLADALAEEIRSAVSTRTNRGLATAVVLVNMVGECLGTAGDLSPWQ